MKKRSVSIKGHSTSLSLEDEFWDALKYIAKSENKSIAALIAEIDASRQIANNLSSAIRVFIFKRLCSDSHIF
jgi:predicted DNA-binding ribbon-helix-helix protein